MRPLLLAIALLCGFEAAFHVQSAAAETAGYALQHRWVLGGEGGWDYLRLDPATHRLFVTHGTHVTAVETDSGRTVGEIPNTNGVHGVALAPDLGRGWASNGRDTTVTEFDLRTLVVRKTIRVTGAGPDAILYDPATQRLFTFNGRGQNATVIAVTTDSVIATIALGGKPEFAVTGGDGRIFVNIEDKSELAVIDARALAVSARWPLAPGEGPSGLALDAEHQRLFSVCDNGKMMILDAGSGRIVASVPIGQGPDAARYDPGTRYALSSNGEGTLTVVHEDDADHFHVVENVATQRGARTMELDPKTHAVYLATAEFGKAPAPTADNPHPRPPIVPGTFVILVLGGPSSAH